MTGQEIVNAAALYVDDDIEPADGLTAINEGMAELGDMALVHDTATVTADAETWVSLPATTTSVLSVKDSSGEPYTYFDNQDTEIKFRDAGTYEVRIRRMPVPLTDLAQTPEVHPLFHNALTFYVRGWWKMKDDDENQDGLAQIARFEQSASKAFTILARKRGPKQMAVIRHA